MERLTVFAQATLHATHNWPEAAQSLPTVGFLSHEHYHAFDVEVEIEVHHDDRELEFIVLSQQLRTFLEQSFTVYNGLRRLGRTSCEGLCRLVVQWLRTMYDDGRWCKVTTREDGRLGAALEAHD